jgi:hypothetical protein
MAIFDPVILVWHGKRHTIPADRVLKTIARVEEVLTYQELGEYASGSRNPSISKLCMAYGAVLRSAGAEVSDDEVFAGMFDANTAETVSTAVVSLMSMMIPKSSASKASKSEGNAPAGDDRSSSSKKRTKR